jgi:hypothetical protein
MALSEVELSRELDTSRGVGAGDGSEVTVPQVAVGHEEIRMVEGIEELHAELRSHVLADRPVLLYAEVPIEVFGSAKVR